MGARGAELLPTTGMVWARSIADAVIAAASAGGIGFALSLVVMLVGARGGSSDDFHSIGLGILAVSGMAAAGFAALLGPTLTCVHLARMRMYAGSVPGSTTLRNAIEFRGQATHSPLFPLQVTMVCIAGTAALVAAVMGVLWAQEPQTALYRDVTLAGIALVGVSVVAVLLAWWSTRVSIAPRLAALPAGAIGQRDAAETVLPDNRASRRLLAARGRRLRTPLDELRFIVGWCLVAGVVGIGVAAALRSSGLAAAARLFTMTCVLVVVVLHLSRWVQLTRLPFRLRGASPTAAQQERGRALTADLRDQMLATMILWTLVVIAVVGILFAGEVFGASVEPVAGGIPGIVILWVAGLALLTWVRARLERAGPALREEFGYDVPVDIASAGSSG